VGGLLSASSGCRLVRNFGIWRRESDLGRHGVVAEGVHQRQLRGNLDATAAARVEAGIEYIGSYVLIALFDERKRCAGFRQRLDQGMSLRRQVENAVRRELLGLLSRGRLRSVRLARKWPAGRP
jgi:hypothetical protein